MSKMYTLKDGQPVREDDHDVWARWYETHAQDRIVDRTILPGPVTVSTVFLALDHGHSGQPVLWESMVFTDDEGHPWHDHQERYTSREDATAGHQRIVSAIQLT